jgi:eukaryotic-like serine/threonine-protein kinase
MTIAPGARVRRYQVTAPLGAGGMGEVYLARDVELDRTIALKVLSDAPDLDGERNRRFMQEARAAIALNHPNVAHIYDVGEESGIRFMAMEYVEGETLRARLTRERLELSEAIEIGIQIASGLASAHALGIVHRDIKPENVMIRPDGYVKVLDFGLAKLTARQGADEGPTMVVHTTPGLVMGTMQYMSPEQLRTDDVDPRSDVFSLGVVLYEMFSGRRPFDASTPSGVIAAILTEDPPPLDASLPPSVRAIVNKALAKKRDERFHSAKELAEALKAARDATKRIQSGDVATQILTSVVPTRKAMPWKWIAAAVVALALIGVAAWFAREAGRKNAARAKLAQLETLVEQRKFFAAWDLAAEVSKVLPNDPAVTRAIEKIGIDIDVKSTPPGAQVFLERVNADGSTTPRILAGTTPLTRYRVPFGEYVLRTEKAGFAPHMRTVTLSPIPLDKLWVPPRVPPLDFALLPANEAPPRMVKVTGGRYRMAAWGRPTNEAAVLDDFFIDQFEVTNREFKEFIEAGGYERAEFWKTLPFEKVAELKDTTGLNAPRQWVDQNYPAGRDQYPVTDVTWHEAAAYAEFRGKKLPTLFQWDKAARDGMALPYGLWYPWGLVPAGVTDVAHRANYRGAGAMPVDSLPSGMSSFGAYHLAGNVEEWCLNRFGDGVSATGGSFNSPTYTFGHITSYPPSFSASTLGFRCVKPAGKATTDQGAMAIPFDTMKLEPKPVSDAEYAKIVRFYDYPKTPLNAKVIERRETDVWTRETIEYDGANGVRVTAFLYLPKHVRPPYQVVQFLPAGDVEAGVRSLDTAMESFMAPFIRGGRAVFGVVLRGYIGRRTGANDWPKTSSEEFAERLQERATDIRRGVDYLVTRPDVDRDRIANLGLSAGAYIGMIVTALEPRYRAVGFTGMGMSPESARETIVSANRVTFAPRIRAPKVALHGRWDEAHPLATQAKPLFDIMPEPKKLVVTDSGHMPPLDVTRRVFTELLDEQFGKVRR